MEAYEKLGSFYLGRRLAGDGRSTLRVPLLYDARDLTTHAVCVGMTGSGKTGLCISLLEEAALDGIPAIAVDPKGDLGNLLLTFPDLDATSFRPWVSEDEAERSGVSRDEFARQQADLWRRGLAEWDQSADRIRRLRQSADFAIYTPGSNAGLPISILASLRAPARASGGRDEEVYRERLVTTVTSLLALLGIDADPVRSREHVLLSNLLDHAWEKGLDLDLATLIRLIQDPPLERVGVVDLESFFPARDRFELAMRLNALLAAPGFEGWLEGDPLDIDRLLYSADGKPRLAIVSIAHLGEKERMFFVSMLFNEVLGWIRTRPGTDSLRAILYMDEIFGYMPPVAEPPSKRPLLTLLKQARAYGLGVVLATQNPVDLDYKGLSNTGTWFLGRLQTERDKKRVLEGLEGAAAGHGAFDRAQAERILAGLDKRVFWLHDVHEPEPVLFRTRWAMSYLRGPLTREQIRRLCEPLRSDEAAPAGGASDETRSGTTGGESLAAELSRPVVSPDVPEVFVRPRRFGGDPSYRPGILGRGRVHFTNRARSREAEEQLALLLPLSGDQPGDWGEAEELAVGDLGYDEGPIEKAGFAVSSLSGVDEKLLRRLEKDLADYLYRQRRVRLLRDPLLEETSEVGESDRDFRIRLRERAREQRDRAVDDLRVTYRGRMDRLAERIQKAEQRLERERQQAASSRLDTAVRFGTTLLGAFLGGGKLSASTLSRAGTSARSLGRAGRQAQDVRQAEESLQDLEEKMHSLEAELATEIDDLERRYDPAHQELEEIELRPRRTDVRVDDVVLAWLPFGADGNGEELPLY